MTRRFQPPMAVVAAVLLGSIAVLAVLQYRWLGRISDAERERMTATLNLRAAALANDIDREVTLAFMLFQLEPLFTPSAPDDLSDQIASRLDRWKATARYPRLIEDVYVARRDERGSAALVRFDAATRQLEPGEWPASFAGIREQLDTVAEQTGKDGAFLIKTIAGPVWEDVPAIVVPMPVLPGLRDRVAADRTGRLAPFLSYAVITLNRNYLTGELLPALVQQHFHAAGEEVDYQMAVVDAKGLVYHSTPAYQPAADAEADASAELLRVRPQAFGQMAAEVRQFVHAGRTAAQGGTETTATDERKAPARPGAPGTEAGGDGASRDAEGEQGPTLDRRIFLRESRPLTVLIEPGQPVRERAAVTALAGTASQGSAAKWRLLVKHPSGSLEAAVGSARRRNLLISTGILAVLGASLVLIVASARRSQELARRQMEFVATVSHELRTPLAVIRSAADNLADGVVKDDEQVRKYGTLVRSEGRRLSEMVEQVLEFAGLEHGRPMSLVPVSIDRLMTDVLRASDAIIGDAGVRVEVDIPAGLDAVAGNEAGLRRVFQNLVSNAVKYGAAGGWVGISARRHGSEIRVAIVDRGMGIAAADQARIFEPFYRASDVVAAQIQGAGLGLSLVQRIVQAHGGRIEVSSAKGSGSEFVVHLPAAPDRAAERTEHAPAIFPPESASPRDAT